jgi:hypothetical protein
MSDCFKIYGPFEIENKQKIVDRDHQSEYWNDCVDKEYYDLSFAKGIYLFSLRNAENYNPQYVGMTERDFRTEVFNDRNTVMIFKHFLEERGVLCLHLLAKPKETQRGFSINISDKELYWIEDYIQQTCRIKNPYLLNIGKSRFLLKTAIEGITDNSASRGEHVRTFRNALGIDD